MPITSSFFLWSTETKVEMALREAGFDFAHNGLTHGFVLTDHTENGKMQ